MTDNARDPWTDLLDRAIGNPPPGGPGPQAVVAAGRRAVRRRRIAASAGTAAAVVALVGLVVALRPGGGSPAGAPYASEPKATAPADPTAGAGSASTGPTPDDGSPVPPTVTTGSDQVVVGPAYVTWGPDGLVATDGGEILEQRLGVRLKDFAGPGVRTAAARVRAFDGAIWYVVAREDGDPELINVQGASPWSSLAQFIAWAKEKYARGEGLL